jgi:ankyrin repeat protein
MAELIGLVAILFLIYTLYTGTVSKNAKMIRALKSYDDNKISSHPSADLRQVFGHYSDSKIMRMAISSDLEKANKTAITWMILCFPKKKKTSTDIINRFKHCLDFFTQHHPNVINTPNGDGTTALEVACKRELIDIIPSLLSAGADIKFDIDHIENDEIKTLLTEHAEKSSHTD